MFHNEYDFQLYKFQVLCVSTLPLNKDIVYPVRISTFRETSHFNVRNCNHKELAKISFVVSILFEQ